MDIQWEELNFMCKGSSTFLRPRTTKIHMGTMKIKMIADMHFNFTTYDYNFFSFFIIIIIIKLRIIYNYGQSNNDYKKKKMRNGKCMGNVN